jgi:D-tyrosyl-tRNA(Tyr) deacylase
VSSARVEVDDEIVGAIDRGLVAYIGFGRADTIRDRTWTITKIAGLRVFPDESGRMSLGVRDVGGAILLVSQFTLYGDLERGLRPSFDEAMPPDEAQTWYEAALVELRATGVPVQAGRFRARMRVYSVNDGPVSIWIDSGSRRNTEERARRGERPGP